MPLRDGGDTVTECYLHSFKDASKKAYCAMIYFVYRTEDRKNPCKISCKQNKGGPAKRAFDSTLRVEFGENTCTTHAQLTKRSFVQFVRHRVNEILKLTNKDEWAYCLTDENPADLGSRGVFAS